ncbi:MAG: cytochrome, partial [Conexibacter sp.]|nr:cytochrome [Conexibacter sp.]
RSHDRMQALTLEIILRVVFGVAAGPRLDELRALLKDIVDVGALDIMGWHKPELQRVGPWRRNAARQKRADELIYAEIAERRLAEIAALPPVRWARAVAPAPLETRASTVLYAPDWSRPERWRPALTAWARAFSAGDDVTLALAMRDGDHGAVAEQVLDCLTASGRPEEELPDVLLSEPAWTGSHALVARCDAVLLDPEGDAAARALLSARAPRTVAASAQAIAALAVELCAPALAV